MWSEFWEISLLKKAIIILIILNKIYFFRDANFKSESRDKSKLFSPMNITWYDSRNELSQFKSPARGIFQTLGSGKFQTPRIGNIVNKVLFMIKIIVTNLNCID